MLKPFALFVFFLALLHSLCLGGDIPIIFGNSRDSAIINDAQGHRVAALYWDSNAVKGSENTIIASLGSISLAPPDTCGHNYALNLPLMLRPQTLTPVTFNPYKVRLRMYPSPDNDSLKVFSEHASQWDHVNIFRVNTQTWTYTPGDMFSLFYNFDGNYIEWAIASVSTSDAYTLAALHILKGTINPGDIPDTVTAELLVPRSATATITSGVNLTALSYSQSIIVNGILICAGSEAHPVRIAAGVSVFGISPDTTFQTNIRQVDATWSSIQALGFNESDGRLRNCSFTALGGNDYSRIDFSSGEVQNLSSIKSKVYIDSCHFRSHGMFGHTGAIVVVQNSFFDTITYENTESNSFLHIRNCTILADALLSPFLDINCMWRFEGNRMIYTGYPFYNGNASGFNVINDGYAIVRNNVIQGFRAGVEISYGSKVVAYNNTISNTTNGIQIDGTIDSVSIYNNIMYHCREAAVYAFATTGDWHVNKFWIDHNLWYNPGSYYCPVYPCNIDTEIVNRDSVSWNKDPLFKDTVSYLLSDLSPAIDEGLDSIPSLGWTYRVLDTVIVVPPVLTISSYVGHAPDLGANEYTTVTEVKKFPAIDQTTPGTFSISCFPNPFNPQVTITLAVPARSRVRLEILNVLGQTVSTLLDQEKAPGNYTFAWNGSNAPSGIYFCRMIAGGNFKIAKIVLLK